MGNDRPLGGFRTGSPEGGTPNPFPNTLLDGLGRLGASHFNGVSPVEYRRDPGVSPHVDRIHMGRHTGDTP